MADWTPEQAEAKRRVLFDRHGHLCNAKRKALGKPPEYRTRRANRESDARWDAFNAALNSPAPESASPDLAGAA